MLHLGYQPCQRPNVYPTPPGNYRSFRTTDGSVICRRCNQVGHCASACSGNLPPHRAPTHQNHRDDYVPPASPNIYSHRTLSIAPQINIPNALSIDHIHDTMGYPCPRNATYTNPSRRPPFSFTDQTDKYQARRSNIPAKTTIIVT